MAPTTRSSEHSCGKCKLPVKVYVKCSVCDQYYHPLCLLKIPGTNIRENGDICCCNRESRSACCCQEKDLKIKELKRRLRNVNSQTFERTFPGADESSVEVNPDQSQDYPEFLDHDTSAADISQDIALIREQMKAMESALTTKLTIVETLLKEKRAIEREDNLKNIAKIQKVNINKPAVTSGSEPCKRISKQNPVSQQALENTSSDGGNINVGKILIVGDSQCRGATQLFNDYVGKCYSVETFLKPNAMLEDVARDLPQMTRNFGGKDLVVVFAGTNDVIRQRELNQDIILNLGTGMSETNLCIVSVPKLNVKPELLCTINNFNQSMHEVISNINSKSVTWVNLSDILRDDDVTQKSILLNIAEKRRIFFHICTSIVSKITHSNKNTNTNKNKHFKEHSSSEDDSVVASKNTCAPSQSNKCETIDKACSDRDCNVIIVSENFCPATANLRAP